MKIEHAITECGCCIGRDSVGEFRGSWYPNPPLGDGWEMVKWLDEESARGGLKKSMATHHLTRDRTGTGPVNPRIPVLQSA
jgi:hypothetical protein